MNILLVSETLETGGAETFVIRLANALAERHQVIVAVLHGDRIQPQLAEQLDRRVRLERLCLPAERWLWRFDRLLRHAHIDAAVIHSLQRRWLRRLITREQPDVVHSHLLKADRLVAEIRSAAPRPPRHVVTLHGDYRPYLQGHADPQMMHVAERIGHVVRTANAVVGIAREQLDHLASAYPARKAKFHLIYNGYELPSGFAADAHSHPGRFTFIMVARGLKEKGWALLISAFKQLAGDCRLLLVGQGDHLEELRARYAHDTRIIFTGFHPRPIELIRDADVFVFPSVYPAESLPTVVIEALACGKPVIATDIGEIRAMLETPTGAMAGRLLPFDGTEMSVVELRTAMQEVINDTAGRAAMAQAASDAFERFAMPKCVAAYEQLYRTGDQPAALPARRSLP